MTDSMFNPLLQPIALPLLAGLVCLLVPKRAERLGAWLAILACAATLSATLPLFAGGYRYQAAGTELLRVDRLSGFILVAATAFALLISVYSFEYMKGKKGQRLFAACLLWSLAFSCGVLLAGDLVVLVVCWGLLAVTLYGMIGLSGPDAANAARKTLMIVGGSDALLVLGTALLWAHHGSTRMDAGKLSLDSAADYLALLCFGASAFAKAGAFPLHSWLPDCGEKAHAPVTAFLPASLDKLLGIYLLVRIVTELFAMTPATNGLLMLFGSLTILGAVLMALVQHDLKRLLAFHAVSQVGYMILGIGTGTALGLAGGLFHMLNHAIYKCCLFLGAGVVEDKTGSVDLDRLGGLATRLPITFVACLIASLSISGIPPLNGFASKWMIYQAVIQSGFGSGSMLWVLWLTAAVLGSALTLASFVKVLHAVFLCKPSPQVRDCRGWKVAWPTRLPMLGLASLCVIFGVFAFQLPLQSLVQPAVGQPLEFDGTWLASQAAGLLLIVLAFGWMVYALTMRSGKLRKVPTYIGGERFEEIRISGVPAGTARHVEVTGVDFYGTVQQLPVLSRLYELANRKRFDLYSTLGKPALQLSALLRVTHGGSLPMYLTWFVLGLLVILCVIMGGTA